MPRKSVTGDAGKITTIVAQFRTMPLLAAEIALGLVTQAVKERQAVGKRVAAGKMKGDSAGTGTGDGTATTAVDAATKSAIAPRAKRKPGPKSGPRAVAADGSVKPRRKPGPKKGYKKGKPATDATDATGGASEITDAVALPPQGEPELALDLG